MLFARPGIQRLLLVLALAGMTPGVAAAQSEPPGGLPLPDQLTAASLTAALAELDRSRTTIVAEVGSRAVTWGDIADAIRAMPRIVSTIPFQQLYQSAAVQVMQQKALALRAEAAGLEKDPLVQRRLKNATDEALANEILRRSLAPNITEPALRGVYDGVIAGKPGPDEVRPRIIMVDTRDEATALIQRLQDGGDFAALARQFSKDGTAANGGDLGYIRLDLLAPEIGAVAFALGIGQMTSFPVRSGNLWCIIRVDSRRQVSAPSFEEARAALEQDVIHAGVPELKRLALKDAAVTYYGLAGKKPPPQRPQ